MWGYVPVNFVDAVLYSDISLLKGTKCFESYGHSVGI